MIKNENSSSGRSLKMFGCVVGGKYREKRESERREETRIAKNYEKFNFFPSSFCFQFLFVFIVRFASSLAGLFSVRLFINEC
jgi:hypothetical protein